MAHFTRLPTELLLLIDSYLPLGDQLSLRQVNERLRAFSPSSTTIARQLQSPGNEEALFHQLRKQMRENPYHYELECTNCRHYHTTEQLESFFASEGRRHAVAVNRVRCCVDLAREPHVTPYFDDVTYVEYTYGSLSAPPCSWCGKRHLQSAYPLKVECSMPCSSGAGAKKFPAKTFGRDCNGNRKTAITNQVQRETAQRLMFEEDKCSDPSRRTSRERAKPASKKSLVVGRNSCSCSSK